MKYFIEKTRLVNEGTIYNASVLIEDAYIKKIVPYDTVPDKDAIVIDGRGLHLLPGVIDTHVHFREPGFTYKADIESESRAAVAGGVTSFIDMPNTNPQTITEEALDNKIQLATGRSWANFGFMVGATNHNMSDLLQIPSEKVAGIKLFLGSSTGNMLVNDQQEMERLFNESNKIIVAHCEDEEIIHSNTEMIKRKYGMDAPANCHPFIRNTQACLKATSQAIQMAIGKKAHLHIAHLSTREEIDLLKQLKPDHITAELCVNYLWFDASGYALLGNKLKCNPSLKSPENRLGLLAELSGDYIHTIATDHAPHTLQEKNQSYFSAPSGIPGVQHALPMMLSLCFQGYSTLETMVEKMCHNPASLFKIEKRGFIREGYYADLILVDLQAEQTINKENILYKCNWSLLEGETLQSIVKTTFVNGRKVYENGIFTDSSSGKALHFK